MASIEQPILTIAIPTYNRVEKIQSQIRLLLPQLDQRVHLIIYDNFSTIPVKSYFSNEELAKFTLVRNRVNVGGDANIARCFENCTTKWLWTLSDDDLVKENAIEIVLKEINKDTEAVFLNFCIGVSFESKGFFSLIREFKKASVFSSSFTMSSCVYNMAKLQESLQDYYNHLSSMMGTIILVLKYVQKNDKATCRFIDSTPINKFNKEVGWNYFTYIYRTRLFLEAFKFENKNYYNKSLFLGCHVTNYLLLVLNREESKVSYRKRLKLFLIVVRNQGLINALLYCPFILLSSFIKVVLNIKSLRI